jgi:competence protein ComEC
MPVPHWPILLGFCLGILGLQNCAELPFSNYPAVSLTLVVTAISVVLWTASRYSPHRLAQSFLLLASTVLFGFSYAHWRAEIRLADALDTAWEGRDVVIEGNISRLPQRLTNSPRPAWRFEFQVDKTLSVEAKIPNNLRLSWYGQLPTRPLDEDEASDSETSPTETTLQPGDRWRFKVRLKRPHGNANPGGFDYEGWLFEHNIRATGYVRGSSDIRDETTPVYLGKAAWRFDLWIEQLRDQIRRQMLALFPPETHPQIGI